MSHFDRSTPTLDEPTKPRNVGSRLAGFGDRLARAFTATDPVYMSESGSRSLPTATTLLRSTST